MILRLRLEFKTAIHHGSGSGVLGIVDRAFLRDERGMPYLAGSAIKGKLRFAAIQITGVSAEHRERPYCRREPLCAVCRVFGNPMHAGRALFDDAFPVRSPEGILLEAQLRSSAFPLMPSLNAVRATTAIDRVSGTARKQHLFSTETVSGLVRFEALIRGLEDGDADLLRDCAKVLTHFGSDSARGLGLCSYELEAVREGQ